MIDPVLTEAMCLHQPIMAELIRQAATVDTDRLLAMIGDSDRDELRPESYIHSPGVAVVPIHGVLSKRRRYWWSSVLSMDDLTVIIEELSTRPDIDSIVLDIDSPGGTVVGTELLADAVFAARQSANIVAVVNELCASAALWIGSAASHIVMPASAQIGSLGAYSLHFDDSKMLTEIGIDKTVIFAGHYKAISERPLTDDLKAHRQDIVDGWYSQFVDAMARHRGVDAQYVLDNWADARMFLGSDAVSNGLADEIGTLQDVLQSLRAGRSGRIHQPAPLQSREADHVKLSIRQTDGVIVSTDDKGNATEHGALSTFGITAALLIAHCADAVAELQDSAVKDETATIQEAARSACTAELATLCDALGPEQGVAAFKAGHDLNTAKAAAYDAAQKELAETQAALAKAQAGGGRRPGFSVSDGTAPGTNSQLAAAGVDEKNLPYVAAWNSNEGGCQDVYPSFEAFAAAMRHGIHA